MFMSDKKLSMRLIKLLSAGVMVNYAVKYGLTGLVLSPAII